jgi:hypothetical protein
MSAVTRREAIKLASFVVAGVAVNVSCDGDDDEEQEQEQEPRSTVVTRVATVYDQSVRCGTGEKIWTGPDASVVHVAMVAGANCTASLRFVDKRTQQSADAGAPPAAPGTTRSLTITVPDTQVLAFSCTGPAGAECSVTITAVDPPLPPNVTNGAAQVVQGGATVTNPTTPPPIGTPVRVDCSQNAVLWEGPSSYVTVRFEGTAQCRARVATEGDQLSEEITDDRPFCRTFGPVTKVTGYCDGAGNSQCEFQVTETIQLP